MNIDELTIGQARELASMSPPAILPCKSCGEESSLDDFGIGQTVIIRTYAAGVWCGELMQKAGKEVILGKARRMWQWWSARSISLSGVARYGIIREKSRIAPAVNRVWLEAIEIIPVEGQAATSIMEAPDAEAE